MHKHWMNMINRKHSIEFLFAKYSLFYSELKSVKIKNSLTFVVNDGQKILFTGETQKVHIIDTHIFILSN